MRRNTERELWDYFESRMGRHDIGHAETLTRDQVEGWLRRIEREAREDVYREFGIEGVKAGEAVLRLSLVDLTTLSDACHVAYLTYTTHENRRWVPSAMLGMLDSEAAQLQKTWAKVSEAKHSLGVGKEVRS